MPGTFYSRVYELLTCQTKENGAVVRSMVTRIWINFN